MAVDRWWTDERVDELKARWQDGETSREIQFNMGARSRNAVLGKAYRLGLWRATVQNNAARVSNKARRKALRYVDNRYVVVREEAVEEPPPSIFKNPVPFAELAAEHCRWPGEAGPQMMFCGEPKLNGYSYCSHHCRIAFVKPGATPRAPR